VITNYTTEPDLMEDFKLIKAIDALEQYFSNGEDKWFPSISVIWMIKQLAGHDSSVLHGAKTLPVSFGGVHPRPNQFQATEHPSFR
jgi:hypothetical protein